MADENKNIDEQLDLLFGTSDTTVPEKTPVTVPVEETVENTMDDVTELFRQKAEDTPEDDILEPVEEDLVPVEESEDIEEDLLDEDLDEDYDEAYEDESFDEALAEAEAAKPLPKKVAIEEVKTESKNVSDDDDEILSESAVKTRRESTDARIKKEYVSFWIFTAVVAVVTAIAVLLILNFRGILNVGPFTPKETTEASSEEVTTESIAETEEVTEDTTEEVTTEEVTEEVTEETEETSEEVTEETEETSEEAQETESESEEVVESTEAEGDTAAVLQNYANPFMVYGTASLNLRKDPSKEASIIGTMDEFYGGEVISVTEDGAWTEVSSNTLRGFVASEFIITGDDARAIAPAHAEQQVRILADVANIRQTPEINGENVMDSTSKNHMFKFAGEEGDFYKIITDDNREGYVSKDISSLNYYLKEAVIYRGEPAEN